MYWDNEINDNIVNEWLIDNLGLKKIAFSLSVNQLGKITHLQINKKLSASQITKLETKYPELKGKVIEDKTDQ